MAKASASPDDEAARRRASVDSTGTLHIDVSYAAPPGAAPSVMGETCPAAFVTARREESRAAGLRFGSETDAIEEPCRLAGALLGEAGGREGVCGIPRRLRQAGGVSR